MVVPTNTSRKVYSTINHLKPPRPMKSNTLRSRLNKRLWHLWVRMPEKKPWCDSLDLYSNEILHWFNKFLDKFMVIPGWFWLRSLFFGNRLRLTGVDVAWAAKHFVALCSFLLELANGCVKRTLKNVVF